MERNRPIDGWRGLSVTFVIIGHLIGFRYHHFFEARAFRAVLENSETDWTVIVKQVALRFLPPLPSTGVNIFFIISGFIITQIMIREEIERGSISIIAFYIRRVFRIIPALFTYLVSIYLLARLGAFVIPVHSFVSSGLFLCDLPYADCKWWLGHTWSLSVEEQYYLAWPALFVLLGVWRARGVALILCILFCASFAFALSLSFAYIAMGALYALSTRVRNFTDRFATAAAISVFTAIIFIQPLFASFPLAYQLISVAGPAMLAVIFFGTVRGRGPFVFLVANEWLQRLGIISYSVYLWQQMSTGDPALYLQSELSIPILFIVPALFSYYAIERPFIAIGHHFSDLIKRRPAGLISRDGSARI